MFVAIPFTDGIPEGEMVGQDVTNEKLYRTADTVQDINSPVFGFDRAGSYFEKQNQYVRIPPKSLQNRTRARLTDVTWKIPAKFGRCKGTAAGLPWLAVDLILKYFTHKIQGSEPRAAKAQAEVQRCLAATKAAYAFDVAHYKALLPTNPNLNFADWMNRYAFEYNVAFEELKFAQAALAKTRSEPMSDVQGRLDSMVAARSPTTYVVG